VSNEQMNADKLRMRMKMEMSRKGMPFNAKDLVEAQPMQAPVGSLSYVYTPADRDATVAVPIKQDPSYPALVWAWFDTGDGVDGPLKAHILAPPDGLNATVEVLDEEHVESYGRPGEPYVVTADQLPESGRVGRDRYCWSFRPVRRTRP
jgi:hypothetical protein